MVEFQPDDPADKETVFLAELYIDNTLGGELERFGASARAMRKADRDPHAGEARPGVDRDARKGRVEVTNARNEHWDRAIRSSTGGSFDGSMKIADSPSPNPLARQLGLQGVEEMQTHVGYHYFPGYYSESMKLLKNTPEEVSLKVVTGGLYAGAEGHVYRMMPGGVLVIEDSQSMGGA